jgi:hypothetical protein
MLDKDPNRLRNDICDYLDSNPKLIDDLSLEQIIGIEFNQPQGDLKSYIEIMRNENTWGGAIEIKAFCEMYSVNVEVLILSDKKKVLFQPQKSSNILIKISWNGSHFEPVV